MSNEQQVSIAAPPGGVVVRLTPDGGGALSVVGVVGSAAGLLLEPFLRIVSRQPERLQVGEARFCGWRHQSLAVVEPVMLVRTATDSWEVHSHGGRAVADSIVSALCDAGGIECSGSEWQETLDASGNGSVRRRLAQAEGWRAAQILSRQLAGYLEAELGSIEQLVTQSTSIDTTSVLKVEHNLLRLERAARVGLRLPIPWRVVLRGVVNAGKSSLVNALAGYARSLVSPLAGTTRDLLETRLVLDGWEIELVDTAGEIQSQHLPPAAVELAGIKRGQTAVSTADLVLELTPAPNLLNSMSQFVDNTGKRLVVATKADLLQPTEIPGITAEGNVILTSALTNSGVDRLAEAIVRRLVPEAANGDLDRGVPVTTGQLRRVQQVRQKIRQLHAQVGRGVTPDLTDPE